jgi:pimeloyl-ACP methyl ester carboxylesterase
VGRDGAGAGETGWYAICVDLRGHGDSDWSHGGELSIEAFARDMVSIARAFDRPPALAGRR